MKNFLYYILSLLDSNRGYNTQLQKRFKVGDKVVISNLRTMATKLAIGTEVTIIENGRYDYLIEDVVGEKHIVYQFEIRKA